MYDNFTTIPFSNENLDAYFIRKSVLKALNNAIKCFERQLLDIGCVKMPYNNYSLNHSTIEKYTRLYIEGPLIYDLGVRPDFTCYGVNMPFEVNKFDCAFGT